MILDSARAVDALVLKQQNFCMRNIQIASIISHLFHKIAFHMERLWIQNTFRRK